MSSDDGPLLRELNTVRDADMVERILVANSRTVVDVFEAPVSIHELSRLKDRNRPFVIRKYGQNWKVVKKWGNSDILLAEANLEQSLHPNRKYTVYKPEPNGHLNQSHAAPYGNMSLFKYLSCARANKLYLLGVPDKSGRGASPFEAKKGDINQPLFAEDLDSDGALQKVLGIFHDAEAIRRHVFINSDHSFTNLHYDTDWNMYLCVLGSRTWSIAHPLQSKIVGAANGNGSYSKLQPTAGVRGLSQSRLGHMVKFVTVELFPGDTLFVPPTWWHVVEGMHGGFSGGINFFFTYDKIDIKSPLDRGWAWLDDDASDLHALQHSKHTLNRANTRSLLHLANEGDFDKKISTWTADISSSSLFREVMSHCSQGCTDWKLCRQLLCVAVKSWLSEGADGESLQALCNELLCILERRRLLLGSGRNSSKRKR